MNNIPLGKSATSFSKHSCKERGIDGYEGNVPFRRGPGKASLRRWGISWVINDKLKQIEWPGNRVFWAECSREVQWPQLNKPGLSEEQKEGWCAWRRLRRVLREAQRWHDFYHTVFWRLYFIWCRTHTHTPVFLSNIASTHTAVEWKICSPSWFLSFKEKEIRLFFSHWIDFKKLQLFMLLDRTKPGSIRKSEEYKYFNTSPCIAMKTLRGWGWYFLAPLNLRCALAKFTWANCNIRLSTSCSRMLENL